MIEHYTQKLLEQQKVKIFGLSFLVLTKTGSEHATQGGNHSIQICGQATESCDCQIINCRKWQATRDSNHTV